MNKPRYTYRLKRMSWAVYEWEYSRRGSTGRPIAEYATREEARAEVYRLNGWKAHT